MFERLCLRIGRLEGAKQLEKANLVSYKDRSELVIELDQGSPTGHLAHKLRDRPVESKARILIIRMKPIGLSEVIAGQRCRIGVRKLVIGKNPARVGG